MWTVKDWIAEWTAGAAAGDRGPVVALDENGCPAELVGVLAPEG